MRDNFHPDAELLNAFAEGVLPEHERQQCLSHLADCARCREVVMLVQSAVPDLAPEPVPALAPALPDRWSWKFWFAPVASVLAACALITTVVIVKRHPDDSRPELQTVVREIPPPRLLKQGAAPNTPQPSTATPNLRRQPSPLMMRKRSELAASSPPPPPPSAVAFQMHPAVGVPMASPPQDTNGTLKRSDVRGFVTDQAGTAVNGANVTIVGSAGAVSGFAKTDPSGEFAIKSVEAGKYEVQIDGDGFRKDVTQLEVKPRQTARVASTLMAGSARLEAETSPSAKADVAVLSAPTTVTIGKRTLSFDPQGVVSVSTNDGKEWKPVRPQWDGKVSDIKAIEKQFQLTTDSGDIRTSRDGQHWKAPKK